MAIPRTLTRRTTVVLLGTVGALALAASGSGAPRESSASEARITLEIWDARSLPDNPFGKAALTVDKMFMRRNPNIKVVRKTFPYASFLTKLSTAVAAKKGPDIFASLAGGTMAAYTRGFEQLDRRITKQLANDLVMTPDSITRGKRYLLPFGINATVWFYNKNLFAKAGLDRNKPPKTWRELLVVCDQLKKVGVTPISAQFRDGYLGEGLHITLAGQLLTAKQNAAWWTGGGSWLQPELRKPFERLVELNKRGCFTPNSHTYDAFGPDQEFDFNNGSAAMVFGGSDINERASKTGLKPSDLGIFRWPRLPDSKYPPYMDVGNYEGMGITVWGKHKDAAWKLIKFHASPTGQREYWRFTKIFPSTRSLKLKVSNPVTKRLLAWASDKNAHSGVYGSAQEEAVLWKRFPQLITGDITVDRLVNELQEQRKKVYPPKGPR
jgi:ABC-type glycerol-3-phosphate transport system substrate-binding protein